MNKFQYGEIRAAGEKNTLAKSSRGAIRRLTGKPLAKRGFSIILKKFTFLVVLGYITT
jgi:hypothetical protein